MFYLKVVGHLVPLGHLGDLLLRLSVLTLEISWLQKYMVLQNVWRDSKWRPHAERHAPSADPKAQMYTQPDREELQYSILCYC